jgi:ribosomal protein S12 methylthiotransferase accessory factor
VSGAKELSAALGKLGVRVVKGAADLTVTLVNDYLEPRLDACNRQHLADRSRWLLVQPSGVFPLVGPVIDPGESACWACLAERMKRNREIKAFLDSGAARRIAASPLTGNTFGHGAVQLAAVEIAKAIATDFRTDLRDHIISLDLPGSTIARHYVARRPQCAACGAKKLRDPRRKPVPITLAGGEKLLMTSGGFRTVSSRATVARYRKHVSPLTGVVTRLERLEADLPLNTNYYAGHNFSEPATTVDDLRAGLSGGSYGKGSTAEQGEASALMEAIERYSGIYQGDEIRTAKRFADFAAGDAIPPNDVLLFSEAQYRQGQSGKPDPDQMMPIPAPFDRSAKIDWSPVWSLRDQRFRYLPTSLLYFFYRGRTDLGHIHADSNGCAAGNTIEEAILQGFLELVERDSYAIWWYNRLSRPEVDLSAFDDSYVRDLRVQFAETGRKVWMIDITTDLGIPSYVAMSHAIENGEDFVEFGSGSHFDPRIAALRSLTELNQFLSLGLSAGRNEGPLSLKDNPYLLPSKQAPVRPDFSAKYGSIDNREQVLSCMRLMSQHGLDFLVLDQTRLDTEVAVLRVIVPGLRHFYRRFAPGRLYDVPVKLGWLDKPRLESELNPLHPHT